MCGKYNFVTETLKHFSQCDSMIFISLLQNALLVSEGLARATTDKMGSPPQVAFFREDPQRLLRALSASFPDQIFDLSADEDGTSSSSYRSCHVVEASSPDRIFVSTATDQAEYRKLLEDLNYHYEFGEGKTVGAGATFLVESGVRCALHLDGKWRRGEVLSVGNDRGRWEAGEDGEDCMAAVRLDDTGEILEETFACSLKPLEQRFCRLEPRGFLYGMKRIVPSGDHWSVEAVNLVKTKLVDCEGVKFKLLSEEKEFVKHVKECNFEAKTPAASFVFCFERPAGALDPAVTVAVDMEKFLVETGEAKWVEGLTPGPIERLPSPPLLRWKPADAPQSKVVEGTCMFVHSDDDRRIIVYLVTEEVEKKLEEIRSVATQAFQGTSPRPQDRFWYAGQPCFVQFHWDLLWYRGQVLKIHKKDTYDVQLIDYGTIQEVGPRGMRKDLLGMADVPTLVTAVEMTDRELKPADGKEKIDRREIVDLHKSFVDKRVVIELDEFPPTTWPYVGRLKNAIEILVGKGPKG